MDSDPASSILIYCLIILFLTLVSGFFAASEIAFISLDRTSLEEMAEEGHKRAKKTLSVLENSPKFLNTIQISIMLIHFSALSITLLTLSPLLKAYFISYDLPYPNILALISSIFLLAFFILVLGELVPKRLV